MISFLKKMIRGFEAGHASPGDTWRPQPTSANQDIGMALPQLWAKSRDLVANNDMAASLVREIVSAVIGHGIVPQSDTNSDDFNDLVDRRFDNWSNRCEPRQILTCYGLVYKGFKAAVTSGESFIVRSRPPADEKMPTPLWLSLYEADMVDVNLSKNLGSGSRIVQGIEFDKRDRCLAYWFHQNHPGDSFGWDVRSSAAAHIRIPAKDVIHLAEHSEFRPQQVRGIPRLTPVLMKIRDIGSFTSSELMKQDIAACFGIIFEGLEDDPDGSKTLCDATKNKIDRLYPGMLAYAPRGTTVKTVQPPSVVGYSDYIKEHKHAVGSGAGVPYANWTGDLSKVNFSSGRMGQGGFIRKTNATQWHTVIPVCCERIWQWFIEADYEAGNITAPIVKVAWSTERFPSVNPAQDEQARQMRLRTGVSTLGMEISADGNNPKRLFRQRSQENALLDKLELILDSDPRNRTLSGTNQPLYDAKVSSGKKPRTGTGA